MSSNNCLGIYFGKKAITAVLISKHHDSYEIGQIDNINIPETFTADDDSARLLWPLYDRYGKHTKVAMAIGGQYYKSHPHHCEFSENKQIDQVLRYDIEDSFAVDAEDIVLCYQKGKIDESGCDIVVHVAQRDKINSILNVFELAQLDPLSVEPDANSWMHYINNCEDIRPNQSLVLLGYAESNLFIMITGNDGLVKVSRNVPAGANVSKAMLTRELRRTFSTLPEDVKPTRLLWHKENLEEADIDKIAKSLNLSCGKAKQKNMTVAIAAGAAIGLNSKEYQIDFRADNLQPKAIVKMREYAFYGLSGAICLFFGIILLLNSQKNSTYGQIDENAKTIIAQAKEEILPRKKSNSTTMIKKNLLKELKSLKNKSAGNVIVENSESAGTNLMLLLNALNNLDENFELLIEEIDINAEQIRTFRGSVLSMDDYEILSSTLQSQKSGLEFVKHDYDNLDVRVDFTIQIKKQ